MAWLMKNSGGMNIERRPEAYLDDALKAELEKTVLPHYPTRRAATLPVLHAVQDKHGWLPYQALEEVAEFLGLSPSEVCDTASFYEMFHLRPVGRHIIWVCQSISCELRGEHDIVTKIQEKLGIETGETTLDGKFTLMHAECLGSCGSAPCCLVDDKLHEDLTVENIDRILDSVK
ncbi:MAG: NADH-quinone oxidoreductase subunit NuoE [Phycisphaeraceae bacterium]